MITATGLPRVSRVLGRLLGLPAVETCLDGRRLATTFEPDDQELVRRSQASEGPVTSLPALHALWSVPEGWPSPTAQLPAAQRDVLLGLTGHVDVEGGLLTRRYQPPGRVRALALSGRSADRVIDRAIRCSPIFERFVVLGPACSAPSATARDAAAGWGIGIVSVSEDGEVSDLLEPARGVVGIPSVYRWWVAELAFKSYAKAQDRN